MQAKSPKDDLIPTRSTLLARLKDWSDDESWRRFFDTYWHLIHAVARKAGLTEAEAQDVVQETLVAVARRMHTFRYDRSLGSFKSWLLQLARWRIADQYRKRKTHEAISQSYSEDTTRADPLDGVADPNGSNLDAVWEEEWQANLRSQALERAKRKVNAKQYQIFDLYALRGWPVEEVARTLEVSVAQVYQARSRVAAIIRKEAEYLETRIL